MYVYNPMLLFYHSSRQVGHTHGLIYLKFAYVKIKPRVKVNLYFETNYIFMFSSYSIDENENINNIE